ncbi:MAG TPA: hypothetical protein PKD55_25800 [Bellilinea sp.]|nr:hypothetical protein [Bellilinea sp.]
MRVNSMVNTNRNSVVYLPKVRNAKALHADHELLLSWWRTRARNDFSGSLLATTFPTEFDWYRAATGNAAAAIGIAIRQMKHNSILAEGVDQSVSAVLCCALDGNAAARVLISCALRRRSKVDPECRDLIQGWLAVRF